MPSMSHRNLAAFARWFLAQPFGSLRPPRSLSLLYRTEGGCVTSVVLHRDAPYQVELFAGPGPGHFPPHRHPSVDSFEVMLGGDIGFTLRGKRLFSEQQLAAVADDGTSIVRGAMIRVRPGDLHGAEIGPAGGAFLSIQRWLNGVQPTSVGLNWEGPAHLSIDGPPYHTILCVDG